MIGGINFEDPAKPGGTFVVRFPVGAKMDKTIFLGKFSTGCTFLLQPTRRLHRRLRFQTVSCCARCHVLPGGRLSRWVIVDELKALPR